MPAEERPFYKPELDVLRLLAFGLVFLHHFFPAGIAQHSRAAALFQTGCEQGVQIFFLLSAYLITHLLLREQERTATVHIRAFYVRRVLRIWPLYFFLTGGAAILTLFFTGVGFPLRALAYFSLLGGNWYVVLHGWVQSAVAPLWTISVEEQFYLLWPMTLRYLSRRGLVAVSVLLTVGSYGTLVLLGMRHAPEYTVRANSLVEFQFFALGAGLALLLYRRSFQPGVAVRCICCAVAVLATWLSVARFHLLAPDGNTAPRLVGGYALLAVSTVCVFLLFLNGALPRWTAPLVYLGRISYGLYAFHFIAFAVTAYPADLLIPAHGKLVAAAAHTALTLLLCLCLAMLSYRFLEQPFLRLKRRFTVVASRDALHTNEPLPGKRITELSEALRIA